MPTLIHQACQHVISISFSKSLSQYWPKLMWSSMISMQVGWLTDRQTDITSKHTTPISMIGMSLAHRHRGQLTAELATLVIHSPTATFSTPLTWRRLCLRWTTARRLVCNTALDLWVMKQIPHANTVKYLGAYFHSNTGTSDLSEVCREFYGQFNKLSVVGKCWDEMSAVCMVKTYCLPTLYVCKVWSLTDCTLYRICFAWNSCVWKLSKCCRRDSVNLYNISVTLCLFLYDWWKKTVLLVSDALLQ